MKRSDLHHKNITRTARMYTMHSNSKKNKPSNLKYGLFPFMHFMQLLICFFLGLFLVISRTSIMNEETLDLFSTARYYLENSIENNKIDLRDLAVASFSLSIILFYRHLHG